MAKVYFHGTRQMAKQLAYRIVRMLTGRESDTANVARGVFMTLGFAALNSIKQDFIVKSRGGTGADGVKWPPLTKEYLAYGRRFGRGEQAALKKAAGLGKEHRFSPGNQVPDAPMTGSNRNLPSRKGLLSAFQVKRWWDIYYAKRDRFSLSTPWSAKSRAAAAAWTQIKAEGAKTMLEVYGNRQVDILRDTGVLFNSLSPGQLDSPGPNAVYSPPSGDGGDQQIFQLLGNGVIVGTNVPYAEYHQDAKSPNRLRPFLPTREVPDEWEQTWLDAGLQAVEVGARMLFEAA